MYTFAAMTPEQEIEQLRSASESEAKALKGKLRNYVLLRLAVFLAFAAAVYFTWWSGALTGGLMAAGVAFFFFTVHRHSSAKEAYEIEKAYLALCHEELEIAAKGTLHRPDGDAYTDPSHPFTSDLNVFGRHSLFQFLNRTQTPGGEAVLAAQLRTNLLDTAVIKDERDTIADFATHPDWSLRYLAHARRSREDADEAPGEMPDAVKPAGGKALRILLTRLAPAAMIALTVAYGLEAITFNAYLLALAVAGVTTVFFLKKHSHDFAAMAAHSGRIKSSESMLAMLRDRDFGESPFGKKLEAAHLDESAEALQKLQKIIGAIDSRGNIVVGIVLNLLLFWDFQCAYRLYDWQLRYGDRMPLWMALTRETEAYLSLAMYRFNHPNAVDPVWEKTQGIRIDGARHPLLGDEAVANELDLSGDRQFAVITGANMAGKSTYLRTAGILAVMAMRGLPVTARSMHLAPASLYTSMLTVDSLGDNASYFFSELRRLREIVDALESGRPHFIILDEILKGTNSVDKAEGSKLFMQKLLRLPAKGLIATHDLSLCDMAAEHPAAIENLSFEVEFEGGKLSFDYRLRKGVCQNMNASFLLKEMGLV